MIDHFNYSLMKRALLALSFCFGSAAVTKKLQGCRRCFFQEFCKKNIQIWIIFFKITKNFNKIILDITTGIAVRPVL